MIMTNQLTALVALEKALEAGETSSSDMFLNAQLAFQTWEHLVMQVASGKCMNAAIALAEVVMPDRDWNIDGTGYASISDETGAWICREHKIPARAMLLAIIAAKKLELQNG